ncbi:hypothetical protein L1987_60356 [Smallanthus sonchifolius]|uniref:Uncharacterized protein n=1 Tax=Smallanthus sonchifolius TaxID=185202 RepID=A0ACB9D7U7_9ASTR|nr:hypothetical protein L1987_60356 [Smallanthus sonchifolius]
MATVSNHDRRRRRDSTCVVAKARPDHSTFVTPTDGWSRLVVVVLGGNDRGSWWFLSRRVDRVQGRRQQGVDLAAGDGFGPDLSEFILPASHDFPACQATAEPRVPPWSSGHFKRLFPAIKVRPNSFVSSIEVPAAN